MSGAVHLRWPRHLASCDGPQAAAQVHRRSDAGAGPLREEPGWGERRGCGFTRPAPGAVNLCTAALENGGVQRAGREGALPRKSAGVRNTVDTDAPRDQLAEFTAHVAER